MTVNSTKNCTVDSGYNATEDYKNSRNKLYQEIQQINIDDFKNKESIERSQVINLMKQANDVYKNNFKDFQGRCKGHTNEQDFNNLKQNFLNKIQDISDLIKKIPRTQKTTQAFSNRETKNTFYRNRAAVKTASLKEKIHYYSSSWSDAFLGTGLALMLFS